MGRQKTDPEKGPSSFLRVSQRLERPLKNRKDYQAVMPEQVSKLLKGKGGGLEREHDLFTASRHW